VREVVIDPPERTFEERATIEVGDRVVELSYHGRAHTDGDIAIVIPDADVLFAGDLLEEGAPPSFGDSFPLEWPATVEQLLPRELQVEHVARLDPVLRADDRDHVAFVTLDRDVEQLLVTEELDDVGLRPDRGRVRQLAELEVLRPEARYERARAIHPAAVA